MVAWTRPAAAALLAAVFALAGCGRRADLLALRDQPDVSAACRLDSEGRLRISIHNRGKKTAKATTTQVEFGSLPPIRLPTRPVPPGASETVSYRVPEECFQPVCRFRITVDARGEVDETDETNNVEEGFCRETPDTNG